MVMIEAIVWYLFLLDSVGANVAVWCCAGWFKKKFKGSWLMKHLPLKKGWAVVYLILVIWIGCALYRLGIFPY